MAVFAFHLDSQFAIQKYFFHIVRFISKMLKIKIAQLEYSFFYYFFLAPLLTSGLSKLGQKE